MTPQEEIAAYEAEKREAQLHQFAAAVLTGTIAYDGVWDADEACQNAWKWAEKMMRLKPEPDHG